MIEVVVEMPPTYEPPIPPPGWELAEVRIDCEKHFGFEMKITDRLGPREVCASIGSKFEGMLKLWAVATDADGVDAKTCEWTIWEVKNGHRVQKRMPGWSNWK